MKPFAILLVVLIFALSCSTETSTPAQTVTSSQTVQSTAPAEAAEDEPLSQRCTNAQHQFSVSFPAGWQTNAGEVIPACSAFHPDSFEIPRDSEMPFEIAVVIGVQQRSAEDLTRPTMWDRIVSSERVTVSGRDAWRIESEATGEGLAPPGMRSLHYAIELGDGRSLLASTHDTGPPSYQRNKQVLARMVQSLKLP